MPQNQTEHKVFQIGFNRCGTKYLTKIFESNGYISKHWEGGSLAEDIAYSKAAMIKPLLRWPDAVFFSDMESVHKPHRPPLFAFKEYKFLHRWFPEAIFILNIRNVSDWIASRFSHHGGQYKQFWAYHFDLDPSELPKIWQKEWEEHITAVTEYFRGYEKFFVYDIDSNRPEELAENLQPWLELNRLPRVEENIRKAVREKQRISVSQPNPATRTKNFYPDEGFIESVSRHCIGNLDFSNQAQTESVGSDIFGIWDGGDTIHGRDGTELPIKLGDDGLFHAKTDILKLDRTESIVNEVIALGLHGQIQIDMQDSRRYGTDQGPHVNSPLIVYNRRQKTTNMILWPLPGYHTLGQPHFVHSESIDKMDFEDKSDRAVWRGNLSGRPNEVLAPTISERRGANVILEHLAKIEESDEEALINIRQELLGITRYNLVARCFMSSDIDALLTLSFKHLSVKKSPLLSLFCGKRVELDWFFQSKYILSLSGFDTGSNFLMAANSNSVVMKEEDGWELFYTNEFKPWEHYIPLNEGALDVEDKLDWARANPIKCKEMIKAAQNICAKFANPVNRRDILINTFEATQSDGG